MVMLIMLMLLLNLMLMLMLLSMLLPRLQTKTALSRVSRVAKKKVKGLAKKYDAFLASDTLIKQIPRLLGPGLNEVGENIYEAIIAGIIALYLVIWILMQFFAGRKVPLTGDSDNLNVKVLDLKSTIKFKMKKVVILFSSECC